MRFSAVCLLMVTLSQAAYASTLAIMDSGTDLDHRLLKDHVWVNKGEIPGNGKDDDHNGYADDVNGWNFVDNNNELVNHKLFGSFSTNPTKYFELQRKVLLGQATADDKKWLKGCMKDKKCMSELEVFGDFVHGTHVAGIAVKNNPNAVVMPLKVIGSHEDDDGDDQNSSVQNAGDTGASNIRATINEVFSLIPPWTWGNDKGNTKPDPKGQPKDQPKPDLAADDKKMKRFMDMLTLRQLKKESPQFTYSKAMKADAVNCSFGSSMDGALEIAGAIGKELLKRDLSADEKTKYAKYFLAKMNDGGKSLVQGNRDTLFVFAAGNEGTNNSDEPTFPANIRTDNTITVAASTGFEKLASFSNYSPTLVDVAAPGVAIVSSIPDNQMLPLSGTSQAAPYVTNVASLVKDANPALHAADVRNIILGTVDVKDTLKSKVVTSGVVNLERAVAAAQASTHMTVEAAIDHARSAVEDDGTESFIPDVNETETFVLPLKPAWNFK